MASANDQARAANIPPGSQVAFCKFGGVLLGRVLHVEGDTVTYLGQRDRQFHYCPMCWLMVFDV